MALVMVVTHSGSSCGAIDVYEQEMLNGRTLLDT
jgi:hypothetical protein